ncbi:MAG: hypothetical protein FD143_2000 [Ignavibacteria bacterium]|nr:MAG: hypothetical protein FD143_2000 [Ignavibacteria bacterium]KAF0159146.1 MAG: hypothetical protein FD188_2309 [Ignavibacteria bacterium]
MKKLVYISFLWASFSFAQTDWQKWEAKDISYLLPAKNEQKLLTRNSSLVGTVLNSLKSVYSFTISNYDGDNCPFTPTCAVFFVESVERTNIAAGILMFADRFTRDMNFLKDTYRYSLHKNGKHFDPPSNYTLNSHQIIFEPEYND